MSSQGRIAMNPKVMLGKPVIRGTRITIELILRKLGEGTTPADLVDAYPHLTVEDIRAAITYAADMVAHERNSWMADECDFLAVKAATSASCVRCGWSDRRRQQKRRKRAPRPDGAGADPVNVGCSETPLE